MQPRRGCVPASNGRHGSEPKLGKTRSIESVMAAIYAPHGKGRALRLAVASIVILALVGVAVLTWMAVR